MDITTFKVLQEIANRLEIVAEKLYTSHDDIEKDAIAGALMQVTEAIEAALSKFELE